MQKKKSKNYNLPTEDVVEKFEMLSTLLGSISSDMNELSKKKPDNTLNKLKVSMINKILIQLKEILKDENTAEYLDILDEEMLPSNSDAGFIIGQFQSSMRVFRNKYMTDGFNKRWKTRESPDSSVS